MKIRRATMAVVAAGALALAGCTSETDTPEDTGTTNEQGGGGTDAETDDEESTAGGDDDSATSDGGMAAGGDEDTSKADLGDVQTAQDEISFSTGSEQYNAYNDNTSSTNSTYNAVVNNQLIGGFWYWGTDGTVYPNEWFGSYEVTSEDPLTIDYTISDEAVWSDGTPVTANDYLLEWASSNPESLGGVDTPASTRCPTPSASTCRTAWRPRWAPRSSPSCTPSPTRTGSSSSVAPCPRTSWRSRPAWSPTPWRRPSSTGTARPWRRPRSSGTPAGSSTTTRSRTSPSSAGFGLGEGPVPGSGPERGVLRPGPGHGQPHLQVRRPGHPRAGPAER
ncbi:hypothetical protein [Ornithinimicrobium sp. W1665]|uniref:hypothetical protein n=1 Tax=Ornithinimicrobium sp. W1665 TaxID=3416666 RepID=UPI003D6AF941